MQEILTTCCYCGCGCALYLREECGRIVGVSPSRSHPVTRHNLCAKGWHVHEFIHTSDRLTTPLLRKNGSLVPVGWNEALDYAATGLRRIRDRHGGGSLGFLASAKCTNEENYLLQKLARAAFRTNNVDHCARL